MTVLCMGKTDEIFALQWMQKFEKRIPNYFSFQRIEIPDIKNRKNLSEKEQKFKEAEAFSKHIQTNDFLVFLDEKGKGFNSVQFSKFIQNKMLESTKSLIFLIGGPYGFDQNFIKKSNLKLSFSSMTFTHQMIRVFLTEQIYRASTIIDNKPYHHGS